MYLRRIGFGVSAILAMSACNVLVGVVDAEGTGPGGSSTGGGDVGGMGLAGGMGGNGGAPECSETMMCPILDMSTCRVAACVNGVCVNELKPPNTECGMRAHCTMMGECKKDLGAPCDDDGTSCITANCVDGVCCDSKCDGTCQLCEASTGICKSFQNDELDNTGSFPTCDFPYHCNAMSACVGPLGVPCGEVLQCESTHCVDGVCCEHACNETCEACNVPNSVGMCTAIPEGLDDDFPANACLGQGVACNGKRTCLKEIGVTSPNASQCASGNVNIGICTARSCQTLTVGCGGADGPESCCAANVVDAGSFYRNNDNTSRAEISEFALDRFEVSVGRFRAFLNEYDAAGTKPAGGAGKHPLIANTEWDADWSNSKLLPTSSQVKAALSGCGMTGTFPTWSDNVGMNNQLPINCVTWYEAFAFCIWDGGRLPTEAEWNYAAAGGDLQRTYPWGMTMPSATRASYDCLEDGNTMCALTDIVKAGAKSPLGDGRWMHSEMAGNMAEFTFDFYSSSPIVPCVDCANVVGTDRASRGGGWTSASAAISTASRGPNNPDTRSDRVGFRCARDIYPMCGNGVVEPGEECDDKAMDPKISAGCKRCDKVIKVVAGDTHACAITKKGRLKCWGDNSKGQLGQDSTTSIFEPSKWPFINLPAVQDVAVSQDRTCALTQKGQVYCFGSDSVTIGSSLTGLLGTGMSGQPPLGDNLGEMKLLKPLALPTEAVAIASGRAHSCARLKNGDVHCWGSNFSGRLGLGNTTPPIGGIGGPVFTNLPANAIAASYDSTCALLGSDQIACWGENQVAAGFSGVLGINTAEIARGDMPGEMNPPKLVVLPPVIAEVKTITSSGHHYCIETNEGGASTSTYCWGYNPRGQLGHGDMSMWGDGQGGRDMLTLPPTPLGANVVQVSAGRSHTCALYSNGEIKCWGSNLSGELCIGTKGIESIGDAANEMMNIAPLSYSKAKAIQISAGDQLTCALFDNGEVKCWGKNDKGQAGVPFVVMLTDYICDAPGDTLDNIPSVDPL